MRSERSRAIPQAPLAAKKAKRRLAVSQEPLGSRTSLHAEQRQQSGVSRDISLYTRQAVSAPERSSVDLAGPPSNHLSAGAGTGTSSSPGWTAREIGRVTIAEALELTALVARKQPHRYGRFAARWLCLYLEEHEKATLDDVALLVSNLQSLAT